jgi:hypothetical protein
MKRNAALALCLLFVVGCKSKQQAPAGAKDGGETVTADAPGAPDAAPAPDAAEAADAAPPASGFEGRADGVGPLNDSFEVTRASLEKAFPGLTVKEVKKSQGGDLMERYWAIWSKDGKEMLHVQEDDGDIEAVDIVSDDVSNPLGVKIGSTYADVEKALGKLQCANAGDETDWRSDIVVCSSDKAKSYTIDFVSDDGDEASVMLEDPAKLAKALVKAVTWRAPLPGPGNP